MKNIHVIVYAVAMVMAGSFCSCSSSSEDEEIVVREKGEAIHFTAFSEKTRTAYDPGNIWTINWQDGDVIRIYSNDCPDTKTADYRVTGTTSTGTILPSNDAVKLYWDKDKDKTHTFVSGYPASNITGISGDVVTFSFPSAQDNAADYMKNCYLVARNENLKNDFAGPVLLSFNTIMTTLEVTVQGATGGAGKTRTIKNIQFTTKMPGNGSGIQFNTNTKAVAPAAASQTITWTPTDDTKVIAGSATTTANTLKFNIFLPYTEISSSNKLDIAVTFDDESSNEKTYIATLDPSTDIKAGSKAQVVLPELMKHNYPDGISALHEAFISVTDLEF